MIVDMGTGEILSDSPTPYQLMPGLTDEERASLRLDIEKNGIRVPIDVDEFDNILDGHHRAWIAAELGIACPRRIVSGLTEEEKRAHAVSVNVFRRNLTREQRRDLVARLRRDGMSERSIAEVTSLGRSTVQRDLAQVAQMGHLPDEVSGKDGKTYKAKSPVDRINDAKAKHPVKPPRNVPAEERIEQIRPLAASSMTSPQIGAELGISAERVREIARQFDEEIPADAVFNGKFRKFDSNAVLDGIVTGAQVSETSLGLIVFADLDRERLDGWVSSLSESIRSLTTLKNNIKKELTRD